MHSVPGRAIPVRLILCTLVAVSLAGCKTAQIAVSHPMTGLHVVAKFECEDELTGDSIVLKR
jgi:hypothetical protein